MAILGQGQAGQGADVRVIINNQDTAVVERFPHRVRRGMRSGQLHDAVRFDRQLKALVGTADANRATNPFSIVAGIALNPVNQEIVMDGIMMGQCKMVHACCGSHGHGVLVGAVAPVFFCRILMRRVLGIVNHQTGARHELCMAPVAVMHDGFHRAEFRVVVPQRF